MASPAQVPQRPRRSLAGPVVLIVIGVLFLLGNMGVLQMQMIWHGFARFWPLLIILWGVIKLVEYQQAQRAGVRAAGIGAGGVFLLILLIVFGMAATQASRVNWGAIRDEMDINGEDFPLFGHSYDFADQTLQQAFPAGASVHVVNDRGEVALRVSADDQIHVAVRKKINANSEQEASKWNEGTKPTISVSDNTVTVNANTNGAGDHWVSTDLDISIPRKASAVVSTRRGDINLSGRDGDVELSSQRGDVTMDDVKGRVTVNLEHSSARLSQIVGEVNINGRPNDVSLEDVKGPVHLNGEFDSIKLAKIAGPVNFKSARTDMEFVRLDGDLDMDSGDLRADDIVGPFRLATRSKDVRLMGVTGDVRLADENSSIELRMSKVGTMQVDNRKGDIQVYLPDKASFQLDARSRGGEIQSDFAGLKIENNDQMATANGSVGGGGPHLVINNEHGDVEIRKGSSVAEVPAPPTTPKAPRIPEPKSKETEPTEN